MNGVINSFNESKGFGFITTDSGDEVFFHISSVSGLSELLKGQLVEFGTEASEKGVKANNVVILGEMTDSSSQKKRFFTFKDRSIKVSNIKQVDFFEDKDAISVRGTGQVKRMYYKSGQTPKGTGVKTAIIDAGGKIKEENEEMLTFSFDTIVFPHHPYTCAEAFVLDLEQMKWVTKPDISSVKANYIIVITYQKERILLIDSDADYVKNAYNELMQML